MFYQPYNIFPWSPVSNAAKSSPSWLICHTILALIGSYINYSWYLQQENRKINKGRANNKFESLALGCHVIFSLLILTNITNLGNASSKSAFAINLYGLLGLTISYMARSPLIYFLILNVPVYLEIVSLAFYCLS
jgi:hypothetical protein